MYTRISFTWRYFGNSPFRGASIQGAMWVLGVSSPSQPEVSLISSGFGEIPCTEGCLETSCGLSRGCVANLSVDGPAPNGCNPCPCESLQWGWVPRAGGRAALMGPWLIAASA